MRNAETVLGIIRLRRTLESRVLRKAHARFGEGRMEKCSRSNSPAAYSTSTTAAKRGTSSPISPGSSCPSDCATGLTGSDQRDLVSACSLAASVAARASGAPAHPLGERAPDHVLLHARAATARVHEAKDPGSGSKAAWRGLRRRQALQAHLQPLGPAPLRGSGWRFL